MMDTWRLSTGVFLNIILDKRFLLKLNVLLKEYLVTLYSCKMASIGCILIPPFVSFFQESWQPQQLNKLL